VRRTQKYWENAGIVRRDMGMSKQDVTTERQAHTALLIPLLVALEI
jgi:hypothetical protein